MPLERHGNPADYSEPPRPTTNRGAPAMEVGYYPDPWSLSPTSTAASLLGSPTATEPAPTVRLPAKILVAPASVTGMSVPVSATKVTRMILSDPTVVAAALCGRDCRCHRGNRLRWKACSGRPARPRHTRARNRA